MCSIDPTTLKDYILKHDKTVFILEQLKCHHIKVYPNQIRAGFPDGDNATSICVYTDSLKVVTYTHKEANGDIITLVQDVKNFDFISAFKYLHEILKLEFTNTKKETVIAKHDENLNVFSQYLDLGTSSHSFLDLKEPEEFDADEIGEYYPVLHTSWVTEGISERTRKEFNIGYSFKKRRIVIPYKSLSSKDKFIGVVGRTTCEEYETLNIAKYLSMINFPKTQTLYGYAENYKSIQEAGYAVVFESEKSVLKRHSRLDGTGLAVGGHNISDTQLKLLLGLNVDIVICFDNDVSEAHMKKMCKKFFRYTNAYYMADQWNLLGERDSPADLPNKQYEFMFKYKIKFEDKVYG